MSMWVQGGSGGCHHWKYFRPLSLVLLTDFTNPSFPSMVWFSSLKTLGKCIHDGKKNYLDIFKIHYRKYFALGKL